MPRSIFGLPTHILFVHATVVFIPLAALLLLLHAFWPAARNRLGLVTTVVAGIALVLTPLATSSGEELEHAVQRSDLVERHAQLADGMLPWVVGLFLVAAVLWLLDLHRGRDIPVAGNAVAGLRKLALPRWVPAAMTALAVVAAIGSIVWVVLVGHAGAMAAWHGVAQ
jgi:hypothetical protein